MPQVVAEFALGGVKLPCDKGQTHAWGLVAGVKPYVAHFVVTRERAERIAARAKTQLEAELRDPLTSGARGKRPAPKGPLKLRIGSPKVALEKDRSKAGKAGKLTKEQIKAFRAKRTNVVEVEGLYVTALKAGADLNTWTVQVSDRRWLWSRPIVERSYNVTKRSGNTRWNGTQLVPLQAAEVVADLTHHRATLKDGRAWTALEILDDVLAELCGAGGYVIEPAAKRALQAPVQNLHLGDQGADALARVLSHLPGVNVFVDLRGIARVFATLDQSEVAAADAAGRPLDRTGMWRLVDRALVRPGLVRVFMPRELEIRFDLDTDESFPRGKRPPLLENVIKVPDSTFRLASGRVVASGTWITFTEFFAAIATGLNVTSVGAGANPSQYPNGVTEDMVRSYTLPGLQYVARWFVLDGGTYDQIWSARFAAIARHWRRSYRLDAQFSDRVLSFKARRAVLTDSENGLRAPSPVYVDYVLKPQLKALAYRTNDTARSYNVQGWAADLSQAKAAPVSIKILDQGARVFQLEPRADLFGAYEDIQLGEVEGDAPTSTAGDLRALWFSSSGVPVTLKQQFNLSTILSVVPSSPNNEGRLHAVEVTIAEALQLLGKNAPLENHGPVHEAKTKVESARFAWRDGDQASILNSVFNGGSPPLALLSNSDSVRDVARAHAARVCSYLLDRGEGQFSVSLNGNVRPTGNLLAVVHAVGCDGSGLVSYTTTLNMPSAPAQIRVDALLPESTRNALLRLVQEE